MNKDPSIIDAILVDHKVLKKCISVLKNDTTRKDLKRDAAKTFLQVLDDHARAEEQCLYLKLKHDPAFHKMILEALEEHKTAKEKLYQLKPLVDGGVFTDDIEVKMKVLAELVEHHVEEEEDYLFPEMKKKLDKRVLVEYGRAYSEERGLLRAS